jgi:RNA polymerase sigma-70 factor (ECF subfamily)
MIARTKSGHHEPVMRESPLEDGPASGAPPGPEPRRARALFDRHFDFIWRLLRRQGLATPDADDAAQQVFMIAAQKLDAISEGSERSFLYGTALRVAANARRGASRRREVAEEALDAREGGAAPPDERAELVRAWALLDELLAELPEELARVIALAEIEQVEVAEIAALEGIPVGTAASRLRRARQLFRELLAGVQDRNPFGPGDR